MAHFFFRRMAAIRFLTQPTGVKREKWRAEVRLGSATEVVVMTVEEEAHPWPTSEARLASRSF